MDYIYCRSCGGKNPEDATFCNRCGKRLDYSIDVVDLTNVEITESKASSPSTNIESSLTKPNTQKEADNTRLHTEQRKSDPIPPPSESTEPDARWWNNKGNEFYFKGDYESAFDCYSKAIKLDPNLWAGWYNSSLALSKLGRTDEARKAKKKADELGKPQSPQLSDDDQKKSVKDIGQTPGDKSLREEDQKRKVSTEASVLKKRGDNLIDEEQYEEAIKCYRKAVDIDPDYANAWHNLGFAYYKVGQPEKAQECKETATKKIEEKKRITQSTNISNQSFEKVHPKDNSEKETCLNCGAVLPYTQGNWPVGKPKLCPKCGVRVKDPVKYGSGSGQGRTHEEGLKDPNFAGLLSIIPGLGQLYNGQLGKGLLFLFVTIIGLFFGFMVLFIFIVTALIWIYGMFESHNTANKMNCGDIPFKKTKGTQIAIYSLSVLLICLIIGAVASNSASGIGISLAAPITTTKPQTSVPQVGNIEVTGLPLGALVSLDDGGDKIIPHTYYDVPVGSHNIAIHLEGYKPFTTSVFVTAGQTSRFIAALGPVTSQTTIPTPRPTQDPAVVSGVRLVNHHYEISPSGMPLAKGTITNENFYTVSVTMKGQFLDKNNVLVDDGLDYISDLGSGQSALFEIACLGHKDDELGYYKVWVDAVRRKQ